MRRALLLPLSGRARRIVEAGGGPAGGKVADGQAGGIWQAGWPKAAEEQEEKESNSRRKKKGISRAS